MTVYYVLHSGYGTDGGFGDWAPPHWSEDPVKVDGQVVWFRTKDEANKAVEALNKRARKAFYSVGDHCQYDGNFPLEYEARKIVPVSAGSWLPSKAIQKIEASEGDTWKAQDGWYQDDDEDTLESLLNEAAANEVVSYEGTDWKWNRVGTHYRVAGGDWVRAMPADKDA